MPFFARESRRKTPVIVAIKGKDREFGEAAISRVSEILIFIPLLTFSIQSTKIPGQSYMYLRELVGKSLNNPVIEQYSKRFPFFHLKTDGHTGELVFEHDR